MTQINPCTTVATNKHSFLLHKCSRHLHEVKENRRVILLVCLTADLSQTKRQDFFCLCTLFGCLWYKTSHQDFFCVCLLLCEVTQFNNLFYPTAGPDVSDQIQKHLYQQSVRHSKYPHPTLYSIIVTVKHFVVCVEVERPWKIHCIVTQVTATLIRTLQLGPIYPSLLLERGI